MICRIWNQNLEWILMDSGVHHSRAFCHFATHAALSTKQVGFHFSFLLRKCTVDLAKIPRKNADHTWKLQAYVTNMRQVHFFIEFAVFPFANRLISLERKIYFPFNILHFCSPLNISTTNVNSNISIWTLRLYLIWFLVFLYYLCTAL